MFLLFLFALSRSESTDYDDVCDLRCFVGSLVIPVEGDLSIGAGIGMKDIVVHSIQLANFDFEFDEETTLFDNDFRIQIFLDELIANGVYYDALSSGTFTADAKGVTVSVAIRFTQDSDGFIIDTFIYPYPMCNIQIDDLQIHTTQAGLAILTPLIGAIRNKIAPMVCPQIQKLGPNITEMIKPFNDMVRDNLNGSTPYVLPFDDKVIELDTNVIFKALRYVFDTLIENNGPFDLNKLLNRITHNTGKFTLKDLLNITDSMKDFFNFTTVFEVPLPSLNYSLRISLDDFFIDGLNTFHDISLLHVISHYELHTNIGLKHFDVGAAVTLDLKEINTSNIQLGQKVEVRIILDDNKIGFIAQLALPEGRGNDYSSAQCIDIDCIGALFSSQGTGFTNFNLTTTLSEASINLTTGSLQDKLNIAVNYLFDYVSAHYGKFTGAFVTGVLHDKVIPLINDLISTKIDEAECKPQEDPPYKDIDNFSTFMSLAVLGGFGVFLAIFVIFFVNNCKSLRKSFFRDDEFASLLMTKKLPIWFRLLIPFILLLTFALFVSSNTGLGASVFAKFYLGVEGKHVELPSVFDFGLINSILDMWHSGAIVLAVLIAIMSCAWPYTKIVFMFVVWCMPATKIKPHQRQKAIAILDLLGKWSLIDSYVMILMLIAFRMKISLPPIDDLNVFQINLFVFPAYGFITLVVGTILSLLCSQVILAAERYVDKEKLKDHEIELLYEEEEKKRKKELADEYSVSYSYSYSYSDDLPARTTGKANKNKGKPKKKRRITMEVELNDMEPTQDNPKPKKGKKKADNVDPNPPAADPESPLVPDSKPGKKKMTLKQHMLEKESFVVYVWADGLIIKNVVSLSLVFSIILFIFGSYMKTFSFEFVGLAGWALQLLNAEQYREYSVIDLGLQLPKAAEQPNSFTIRCTQAVYVLVTNIMPLIHMICLGVVWFIPLRIKTIHFLEKMCEYMYSWACLDVFVIAIVAAVMEISQLAKFMVGDKCILVDVITKNYFAEEDLIKDHLTCFDVITSLLKGSYLLIAAAVCHTIATIGINFMLHKLFRQMAIYEKKRREDNGMTPLLSKKK